MDKNKTVIILGVATLALLVFNIASCVNVYNQDSLRKKEMLQRMNAEEKVSKASQDSAAYALKLGAVQKQLDDEIAAHQVTKKALIQEQMVGQSLKDDLQKLAKSKEALEEELRKISASKKAKK